MQFDSINTENFSFVLIAGFQFDPNEHDVPGCDKRDDY